MCKNSKNHGFSLVELMVVISIIALILGVLMVSFVDVRKSGRDKKRVSDLAQIEFALNAYAETTRGTFPEQSGPIESGSILGELLSPYWAGTVEDPMAGEGNFGYYYEPDFECEGQRYIVLMAQELERPQNSNAEELCPEITGDAYVVLISGPFVEGGGIDETNSTTNGGWWSDDENQTLKPPEPAPAAPAP